MEINKKVLLISTSKIYGSGYLTYAKDLIKNYFAGIEKLLFIPYARPGGISFDEYTQKPKEFFQELGIVVKGIHEWENKETEGLQWAQGIFVGGGNSFLLLKTLYEKNLIDSIKQKVNSGTPYMGTSAGSNIAGISISTTNDMPIVYPPSFLSLNLVPFNLNPHYLDPDPQNKHQGETRETRIKEFHQFNDQIVIGLREGSSLLIEGNKITLKGNLQARIFKKNQEPYEIQPETDCSFLLQQ